MLAIFWPGPLLFLLFLAILNAYMFTVITLAQLLSWPASRVLPVLRRSVARIVLCGADVLHQWKISGQGLAWLAQRGGGGGGLLVYHHGAVPADYIYTVAWLYLKTGRLVHSVVHRHLLLVPGLQTLAEVMLCSAPSRSQCVSLLQAGRLVGVAPGGAGQAMLGLDWQHRRGYAVVAGQARVPIIALNTDNIDLAYTASTITSPLSHIIYTCTRLTLVPVYGGCPVPLHSHLELVENSAGQDADTLSQLTYQAVYSRGNTNHSANLLSAVQLWFQGEVQENHLRNLVTITPRIFCFFLVLAGYTVVCRLSKLTLQYCFTVLIYLGTR